MISFPDSGATIWRDLRRIFDYIEANLHGELRIADLARMAEVTPSYFHRAFRLTTGQTPLAYITERRVRRAMPLLARADVSIAETCVRVGFVSPAHFTRVFRGATRMNPSDYRASFPPANATIRKDGLGFLRDHARATNYAAIQLGTPELSKTTNGGPSPAGFCLDGCAGPAYAKASAGTQARA